MRDRQNRHVDYLRLSITEQCNLRCTYCIPEGMHYTKQDSYITIDEIESICSILANIGIRKVKITGGEPLVRKDIVDIVRRIKAIKGIEEITLTTNGILLEEKLDALITAGITHINISLDTLDKETFKTISKRDGLERVLSGLEKAIQSDLKSIKINTLIAKGLNEEEILPIALLAKKHKVHIRYIELMPIGCGTKYEVVKNESVKALLEETYGQMKPYKQKIGNGPATYWELDGFLGTIGFISPMSNCFCTECNRIRVTSKGFLKLCLHSKEGIDLRACLEEGMTEEAIQKRVEERIYNKPEKHELETEKSNEDKMMVEIGG